MDLAARADARLKELSSKIQIVPSRDVDRQKLQAAGREINASVGWSHYNSVLGNVDKVAIVADKIVGYIVGSNYIPFIAVHKESQDMKVGEALMVDAIKTAAERGCPRVDLDYRANNPKTKQFYQKIATVLDMKAKVELVGSYAPKEGQEVGDPREHLTYFL